MLSYENNPSDPLNGSSSCRDDQNISGDDNSLPATEVQLISSSVEVPKFSIRDFVFSARNKDIGTNWPFPEKHLKLCLKHGVKDLLPPFESRTSNRKLSPTIYLENRSLVDDTIVTTIQDEEPSERVGRLTVPSLGGVGLTQKITVHQLDLHCDKPDKDSDLLSSDTSNSQIYTSRGRGTFKHHRFSKTSAKTSSSKCKLVVKFGSPSVHSSNDKIMPHKVNSSDVPASKVCPVCKTFTSTSNTTLNAHIDQCLSMEMTSEGLADSRTTAKCKVKPRKMRSMVDIYATALVCTIEDLDRRNGTCWATDLSVPACQTGVNSSKGNDKQITSPSEHDKEDNDDGGVYIDASGRKIRILSKMDSFSSLFTTKEDNESKKSQISKALSTSMKKHHGTKHHKNLKLAVSNEKPLTQNASSSQVLRSNTSLDDSLLSRGSRDAVEADTYRGKEHPRHNIHAAKHSTVKFQKSSEGGLGVDRSFSKEFVRDPACLSESHMRNKSVDDTHISTRHCLGVKRTRSSISKDNKYYNMETNFLKRLKKSSAKPLNQLNGDVKGINANRGGTAKSSINTKHVNHFLQKSAKLCRDRISSSSEQLIRDPEIWKGTLCCTNKEDHLQIDVDEDGDVDSDEFVATLRSESLSIHDTEPECNRNQLTVEGIINHLEKERREVIPMSLDRASNVNTSDEFVDNLSVPLSRSKVVEHGRSKTITKPRKTFTAERNMRSFIRSMNFDDQHRANSYQYRSSPQASNDSSTGPNSLSSLPNPALDEGMCNYNMETDSRATTQGNPCSDIAPIPIPGPPGSFLPSPGNAETEDYQGNSSPTGSSTSSHYEQDDGNTSKPPTSSASNLAAEISEKLAEKFPCPETHAAQASSPLGFHVPNSKVYAVEASVLPWAMKSGSALSVYDDQKTFMKIQDENEPCCCSRKERVNLGSSTINYQESQLLRRRTMSATMHPTKEKTSCRLNTAPNYSSGGSDIYSLSSSSFRDVDTHVLKAPEGFASPKYPEKMNASKFHTTGDSESPSPSAVLRLMGKNLMVTKNDTAPSDANTQMFSQKAASSCKLPDTRSYCSTFQSVVPRDPARNSPSYRSNMGHPFDFRTYNRGSWGEINSPRPGITNNLQAALFDRQRPVQQNMPYNGYAMMPDQIHRGESLPIDFRRAGSEANVCRNSITVPNSLNYTGTSSTMAAAEHNPSRLIHPVYSPAPLSSAPMFMHQHPGNTCFPVAFSAGHSLNPLQVNNYYPLNGSYMLHGEGGSFMSSSLSRSTQPRPGLFYSPKMP